MEKNTRKHIEVSPPHALLRFGTQSLANKATAIVYTLPAGMVLVRVGEGGCVGAWIGLDCWCVTVFLHISQVCTYIRCVLVRGLVCLGNCFPSVHILQVFGRAGEYFTLYHNAWK